MLASRNLLSLASCIRAAEAGSAGRSDEDSIHKAGNASAWSPIPAGLGSMTGWTPSAGTCGCTARRRRQPCAPNSRYARLTHSDIWAQRRKMLPPTGIQVFSKAGQHRW